MTQTPILSAADIITMQLKQLQMLSGMVTQNVTGGNIENDINDINTWMAAEKDGPITLYIKLSQQLMKWVEIELSSNNSSAPVQEILHDDDLHVIEDYFMRQHNAKHTEKVG